MGFVFKRASASSPSITLGFISILFLLSNIVSAQQNSEFSGNVREASVSGSAGLLPGESLDLRTGQLFWTVKEFSIPGDAGLNIDIVRSYNKGDDHPFSFGNWSIDIPRVIVPTHSGGYSNGLLNGTGICRDPSSSDFSSKRVDGTVQVIFTTDKNLTYGGVKLSLPGAAPKEFYINHHLQGAIPFQAASNPNIPSFPLNLSNLTPLPQFNSGLGQNAEWITTDNWIAKCISNSNTDNKYHGFQVTSPRGVTYTFDKLAANLGDIYLTNRLGANTLYVSKVEDQHGNKLVYEYERIALCSSATNAFSDRDDIICPFQQRLTRIKGQNPNGTSDGREVVFTYKDTAAAYSSASNFLIHTISHSGRTWTYEYDGISDPIPSKWAAELKSVTAPENLKTEYKYNGPEMGYLGTNFGSISTVDAPVHKYLNEVILPEGGKISYGYEEVDGTERFSMLSEKVNVINSRTITGQNLNSMNWQFKYSSVDTDGSSSNHSGDINITQVNNPDASVVIYQFDKNSVLGTRPQGLLKKRLVFNSATGDFSHSSESFSGSSDLARKEVFEWDNSVIIGTNLAAVHGLGNLLGHQPRLDKKTIDGSVVTDYSNFTSYGGPQTISEQANYSRTTNRSYYSDTAKWIINLPLNTTIVDPHPEYTDSVSEKDYYVSGLLKHTINNGIKQEFEYYSDGNLEFKKWNKNSTSDPKVSIKYTNYKFGIPRKEEHPEAVVFEREVNNTGTIAWEKDPLGIFKNYQYDGLNRVKKVTVDGSVPTDIIYTYQASNGTVSNVVKKETTGNYQKEVYLDGLGRAYKIVEQDLAPVNSSVQTIYTYIEYDHEGRKTFESFPTYETSLNKAVVKGIETNFDGLGRITSSENTGSNHSTVYCYDSSCNEAGFNYGYIETDARGFKTKYYNQVFGDPAKGLVDRVEVQKSAGPDVFITTVLTRDNSGHIWGIQQGNVLREFKYNSNKLVETAIHPEINETGGASGVKTMKFTYDLQGNLKTKQVNNFTTTFTYDDLNRVDYIDYPNSTTDLDYQYYPDGNIQRLVMVGENSQWDYQYDALKQITEEKLTIDGQVFTVGYSYKRISNQGSSLLETITYPSGLALSMNPDSFGNPHQMGNHIVSASYHPNGQAESILFGNGDEITVEKYASDLVEKISSSTISGAAPINIKYHYDSGYNVSNIDDLNNSLNNKTLFYDGVNRLTTANSRWGAGSFSYDNAHNITSMQLGSDVTSYNYNGSRNRINSVNGSAAYTYNEYGALKFNGRNHFDFDHANRLLKIKETASGNSNDIQYSYDGNGHRTKTIESGITEYSVFNQAGQLIHKKNQSTGEYSNYLYFDGKLLARITECGNLDTDSDGIQDCIEVQAGLDINDPFDAALDSDGDGWSNLYEHQRGTSLRTDDTDADGMKDRYEMSFGLNAFFNDAHSDLDGDGLTNLEERYLGTDPLSIDTDADGIPDHLDDLPNFNYALVPMIFYMND